jgi:hypothetical protein
MTDQADWPHVFPLWYSNGFMDSPNRHERIGRVEYHPTLPAKSHLELAGVALLSIRMPYRHLIPCITALIRRPRNEFIVHLSPQQLRHCYRFPYRGGSCQDFMAPGLQSDLRSQALHEGALIPRGQQVALLKTMFAKSLRS